MMQTTIHSKLQRMAESRLICVLLSVMVAVLAVCPVWAAGPTINGSVYGGGEMAKVDGSTTVDLRGGTIEDAYGGGLGAKAGVNGATADVAADVSGDATVTLDGSIVTGSIYGGNNVNGTPQGHVKVHVLQTQKRAIKDSDPVAYEPYDVAAVYGGGNQAAYVPSQATFDANKGYAEVLIDGCDNSIEYVYGGGNAAPVPATQVTINGADSIYFAFAGGNGKGEGNPGADVGYLGYYSTGSRTEYGTGKARLTVNGGIINSLFGGSNTLGYIRDSAFVKVYDDPETEGCKMNIAEVYGGGNEAPMLCPSVIDLDCAKGLGSIYGGAKKVDVMNNVVLNIHSGSYKNVFGGNNVKGNIYGSITVNIEETGCYPIEIDNLYGGGNLAQYSAYGYNDNGTPKTEGDKFVGPTINLLSFTSIGNVFGGGYGASAKVYGDPVVNMDLVKGEHSALIGDALGSIQNVYGGGEDAATFGDPTLNLTNGTVSVNAYAGGKGEGAVVTGNPTANLLGATVMGDLFGGGSEADVVGNTTVTIADGSLGGNVFGGGEGALYTAADETANPLHKEGAVKASADVSGETYVTINGGEFVVRPLDVRDPQGDRPFAQHYNVYGGGNVASQVGETHVYVTKGMISNESNGTGEFLDNDNPNGIAKVYYNEGQMYFCVFGGGYGKNTSVVGDTWVDFHISDMIDVNTTSIEDDLLEYQSYLDVIGGGFNGTIGGNTNVHVGGNAMCRNVYGGGLYATIGGKGRSGSGKTNVYITGGNVDNVYGGGVMGDIMTSTNVNIGLADALEFDYQEDGTTPRTYIPDNGKITVLMSVYGANDVSGHVPTANIVHNGGTVNQNIYGAGNGDYRGYYTPNHCDYNDGENDNYFIVNHPGDDANSGRTYKGRPQTDNVNITLSGNSGEDKAVVLGQVFGGGNSCTIGQWKAIEKGDEHDGDPHKWRDDPDFFLGGGALHVSLGNHVKIGYSNAELRSASDDVKAMYVRDEENVSGLFMGCSGDVLATQTTDPTNYDYHHYYDAVTRKYWQGFAVYQDGSSTPMTREEGQRSFDAYLNNILIWSDDVTLDIADDAEDIWLANFVGGGFRGSMKRKSATPFSWTLPAGVTVGNCVLGGAYNTDVVYRIYETSDGHNYTETDGHYNYLTNDAGLSQGADYDHIIYGATDNIKGIARFMYAGGVLANDGTPGDVVLTLNNQMDGGDDARVFGGCFASGTVGNTQIDYRATGAYDVYGGGALANLTGNSVVNLLGGSLTNAYGGGLGRLADEEKDYPAVAARVEGNATTTLNGATVDNIYGCNNVNGAPEGNVTVTTTSGTVNHNIYGGGNQANALVSPIVNINGGTITEYVYGGGALANVEGDTKVNLNGGSVGGAYGGGLGSNEVAAIVGGDTEVTLDGSVVTGDGIFGANNINGTPRGHVKVHVLSTTSKGTPGEEYHVAAVYGGGNKAAYEPTSDIDFAEVLIENCDNSIEYVYGGGNAAPVPAASVTIYGADSIGNAFAGGNGAGAGNPGADIGYLGYYRSGHATEYGSGTAELLIYGGKVMKAFGGSNTLGYIRTSTKVQVDEDDDYEGADCELDVRDIHGGGNEAELYCPTEVILGCSEGAEVIYGGSRSADIYGNVTMTIRSGKYGKVFGGNNESGNIYGKLELNIDETGCYPVEIDTLYIGGNKAAYSVYGYYKDGDADTDEDNIGKPRTEGEKLYEDPTINIISFTKIGTVFGGGLGESATIYCDTTHINIEPIPGKFAERIDADGDEAADNDADAVGTIGTIYGGGNAGAVYGNTEVKIGTKATNTHISGNDKETEKEVVVNITDDVFGGGNKAIVSGDTHVTIGQ